MILRTCNKTEIPPIQSKKAVKIIFIEIFLHEILEIRFIPFVISKNPLSKGLTKDVSILKNVNIGDKIIETFARMPLDFKIEIMLEKITTNPPIRSMVEIEVVILSAKTSPKLEKETSFLGLAL